MAYGEYYPKECCTAPSEKEKDIILVKRNNAYTISVGAPLLRPGLTITTEVSEGYVTEIVEKLFRMIREINASPR